MLKVCSSCKKELPLQEFHKNNTRKRGYQVYCKACAIKYYLKNTNSLLVSAARNRAKHRGLAFDLDDHKDELKTRLDVGRCEVTGIPLRLDGGRTYDSPSIDRIDSSKGYTIDNVRIVCWLFNAACWTWGDQQLKEVMIKWLDQIPDGKETMKFIPYLFDLERAYCGASTFFERLDRLGVDPAPYIVPQPFVFSPNEMIIYAQSILHELQEVPDSEDKEYLTAIASRLKTWAEKGYLVHVLP